MSALVSAPEGLADGQVKAVDRVQQRMANEKIHRDGAASPRTTTVMTLQEIADYLRVTRSTIHRLLKRNEIPAFRIGRHWRFNVEEIENWCASRALSRDSKTDD